MNPNFWSAIVIAHTIFVMCVMYLAGKEPEDKTWPRVLIIIYPGLTLLGNIAFFALTFYSLNPMACLLTIIMCIYAGKKVQAWMQGATS